MSFKSVAEEFFATMMGNLSYHGLCSLLLADDYLAGSRAGGLDGNGLHIGD
jgi:hypothetical protein